MKTIAVRSTALDKARAAGMSDPDARKTLGEQALMLIKLAEDDDRAIKVNERRKRLRALYDGDPVTPTNESKDAGVQPVEVPVMRPRLRQRAEAVVRALTTMDPIFMVTEIDRKTKVELVETVLRQALANINFNRIAWMIAETGLVELAVPVVIQPLREDQGHHRASHNGEFVGPMLDPVSPRHFIQWPLRPGHIAQTRIHGHVFDMLDYEIKMFQDSGEYLSAPIAQGSSSPTTNDAKPDGERDGDIKIQGGVRVYDVIMVYLPKEFTAAMQTGEKAGKSKKLRVIVTEHGEVLMVEKWDHDVSLYVWVQPEEDLECLISGNGPASDMQPIQNVVSQMAGEMIHAVGMLNDPPLAEDLPIGQKPMAGTSYKRGERISTRSGSKVQQLQAGAPLEAIIAAINLFVQFAETASQTSNALSSTMNPQETTATEESIRFQGFQMASSADVRAFSDGFIEIARNVLYWVHADLDRWCARYMPDIIANPEALEELRAALRRPLVITLPADQAESLPGVQLQSAQQLLGLIGGLPEPIVPYYLTLVPDLMKAIILNLSLSNKNELLEKLKEIEKRVDQWFAQMGLAGGPGVPMDDGISEPTTTDPLSGMGDSPSASAEVGTGEMPISLADVLGANSPA